MICAPCANAADMRLPEHDDCPGDSWCDCQHMPVPPRFRHANGQPCHGCQICLDVEEVQTDPGRRYSLDEIAAEFGVNLDDDERDRDL